MNFKFNFGAKFVTCLFSQFQPVFAGPCSQKAGYSVEFLKSSSPDQVHLTNGIALEMFTYSKSKLTSGENYQKGVKLILRLSGIEQTITPRLLNTARTYLNRLQMRKQSLRACKLDSFLHTTFKRFNVPNAQQPPAAWPSSSSPSASPTLSVSNASTTPYVPVLSLC